MKRRRRCLWRRRRRRRRHCNAKPSKKAENFPTTGKGAEREKNQSINFGRRQCWLKKKNRDTTNCSDEEQTVVKNWSNRFFLQSKQKRIKHLILKLAGVKASAIVIL